MLYNEFIKIVGSAPLDLEFLPYIFTCVILYLVCRFSIEFLISIFKLILSKF